MYKRLKLMFYNSYNLILFNTYFLLIDLDKPTKRFDLFYKFDFRMSVISIHSIQF